MKKVYSQIADIIQTELLKRGFVVNVSCTPTPDNSLKVITDEFQTTPVIFKKVWIESFGVKVEEHENSKGIKYTDYHISLDVFYEHFGGGKNGCNLFSISLRKFEDWDEVKIISIY
jgi:hypothetical protein